MDCPNAISSDLHLLVLKSDVPTDVIAAIAKFLQNEDDAQCFSFFTTSIYDTAWMSMVPKPDEPQGSWLFPESFGHLLKSQQSDGTWKAYASPVDGILNTLAALLALLVHSTTPNTDDEISRDGLVARIDGARVGLDSLLHTWDVNSTLHVGFEVLVPSLLSRVADYGIHFAFPGRHCLYALHATKTEKFRPEMVYLKQSTTLLHSLESLVGTIDFDQVSHHCTRESGIFGSPAATAAYLINSSKWDDNAEMYLKIMLGRSSDGGVPSAFPTSLFESSWALSTLISYVVQRHDIDHAVADSLTSYYQRILDAQAGIVGFTPGVLGDADDTARVLLLLSLLGCEVDPNPMLDKFKSSCCFRTYQLEGSPSFSANCNVLLALLYCRGIEETSTTEHIQLAIEHLISIWNAGDIKDKWNLSPSYSMMLLTHALVAVLKKVNEDVLTSLPSHFVYQAIPITLCQILSRTLALQSEDGTYGSRAEEIAYSVITIADCLALPWDSGLHETIQTSFRKASNRLAAMSRENETTPDYLWVEKVTYGSALLRKIYLLTARNVTVKKPVWNSKIRQMFTATAEHGLKFRSMLPQLPLFTGANLEHVTLALVEGSRYAERLQTHRNTIFPRDQIPMTQDKYLTYIPVIWTVVNLTRKQILSPDCLWQMIFLSMLNYHVDEYMETFVQQLPTAELPMLLSSLYQYCGLGDAPRGMPSFRLQSRVNGIKPGNSGSITNTELSCRAAPGASDAIETLIRYITHIRQHPAVRTTSPAYEGSLTSALYDFLCAHVEQNINSQAQFHHPGPASPAETTAAELIIPISHRGYYPWLHTCGASSTSCPLSFRFFLALLSSRGSALSSPPSPPLSTPPPPPPPSSAHSILPPPRQNSHAWIRAEARRHRTSFLHTPRSMYLADAAAAHLAALCRMYNDCGSADRDSAEESLNSLDFAEFAFAGRREEEKEEEEEEEEKEERLKAVAVEEKDYSAMEKREKKGVAKAEYQAVGSERKKGAVDKSRAKKDTLLDLADFERECLNAALAGLDEAIGDPNNMEAVRCLVDVTDLFGQIYVLNDIASRKM